MSSHLLQSPNVQFGQNTERRLTTTDRKRKAAGLDVVPEYGTSAKRPARAGSAQPARSAPAPNRSAPTVSGGGERAHTH
eukprot:1159607-Pelagomonas_calceolata.AAC.9